ncbi:unnamed protein product [Mucor hiemalis]
MMGYHIGEAVVIIGAMYKATPTKESLFDSVGTYNVALSKGSTRRQKFTIGSAFAKTTSFNQLWML